MTQEVEEASNVLEKMVDTQDELKRNVEGESVYK